MQQHISKPEHAPLFAHPQLLEARRGVVAAVDKLVAYKAEHTSETKVFMSQVTSGARAVICLPREEFLEVCSFLSDSPALHPHPAKTAAAAQQDMEAAAATGILAPFRREFSALRIDCQLKNLSAADTAVVETQVAASAAALVFHEEGWSSNMQALRMMQLAVAAHATSTRPARTRQLQQQRQPRSAAGGLSAAVAAGATPSPAAAAAMQAQQAGPVQQQQQQAGLAAGGSSAAAAAGATPSPAAAAAMQAQQAGPVQQQQQQPGPAPAPGAQMEIDPVSREDVVVLVQTWVPCQARLKQARAEAAEARDRRAGGSLATPQPVDAMMIDS